MNTVLIGVLAYVAVQLLIGLLVSRKIRSESDYLLAGRSLGLGLATFSMFATWFGAETCIGSAGRMYADGLSASSADPFGYGVCLIVAGLLFAAPLWKRGLTTIGDLFRQRYSIGVERLAVLIMAPTSVLWAAAQIRAFGQVLDASSELGVLMATTLAAAVAIIYTVSGGLLADVLTDLVQGIALIVGLVVLFIVLFPELGDALNRVEPARRTLFAGSISPLAHLEAWAIPICGSVVAQELAARMLAAKSPGIARSSAVVGGSLYIVIGLIPLVIGLCGPALMPNLEDSEQILPALAQKHLPTFAYILFAGALVSAILSTVDSTLLAAASLVSHNLIVPLRPRASEREKVRYARLGVVVFGVVAFALALQADSIFSLVESASAFGSAGIFTVVVFGLFTKLGGPWSALSALVAGVVVWVLGNHVMEMPHPYLASLAASFAAYVIGALFESGAVSNVTNRTNEEHASI